MHWSNILVKLGADVNKTQVETPLLPSLETPTVVLACMAFFLHSTVMILTLTFASLRQQPRSEAVLGYLAAGLLHNGVFVPLATADTLHHRERDPFSAASIAAVTVYTLSRMAGLLSLSCLATLDILDCGRAGQHSCVRTFLPHVGSAMVWVFSVCTALMQLIHVCFTEDQPHLHEPFPEGPFAIKLVSFIAPLCMALVTSAILTLTWFCREGSRASPKLRRRRRAEESEASSAPLLQVPDGRASPEKAEPPAFPADVVIIVWITVICVLPEFFVIYNPKEANKVHANMWLLTWLHRCLRQLTVPTVWLLTEPYRHALLSFRHVVAKMVRKAFWGSNDALLVRAQPPCIICDNAASQQNGGSSRVTFLQPNISRVTSLQNGGPSHVMSQQNGGSSHVASLQQNGGCNHVTSPQQDEGCSHSSPLQNGESSHMTSLQNGGSSHAMSPLLSSTHVTSLHPVSTGTASLSNGASCHATRALNGATNRGPSAACRSDVANGMAPRSCPTLQHYAYRALPQGAPGSPGGTPPFQFCLDIPETRC